MPWLERTWASELNHGFFTYYMYIPWTWKNGSWIETSGEKDYSRKVPKEWQLKPPRKKKKDYSGWAPGIEYTLHLPSTITRASSIFPVGVVCIIELLSTAYGCISLVPRPHPRGEEKGLVQYRVHFFHSIRRMEVTNHVTWYRKEPIAYLQRLLNQWRWRCSPHKTRGTKKSTASAFPGPCPNPNP